MSDDLVKRARHNALSDMPHYASVELIEELADRIEELEAKLANASDRIQGLEELLWAAEKDANEAEAYAEELEAKLARAVEALELALELADNDLVDFSRYGLSCDADINKHYRTTLAELTGGKDE